MKTHALTCYMFLLPTLACTSSFPGEVEAGLFDFWSSIAQKENCKPDMAAEGSFKFEGRFRLKSNLVDGYFVYRSTHRTAQFDGKNMVSEYRTGLSLPNTCENCEQRVVETLKLSLLSESQNEALDNQCPCEAPEAPLPVDEAQNIFPPRLAPGGLDVVRACGNLTVEQDCPEECRKEVLVYYVEGIRKE